MGPSVRSVDRGSREDNTAASATVDFTRSIVPRITVHRNDLVLSREHFTNLDCSKQTSTQYFVQPGYVWTSTFDIAED
jgi:hypothetical protein